MELGVFLVFVGGFLLCAVLVFLVSFFGVQGQTFEEALEAQRNKLKEKDKKKEKKKETTSDKKKKPKKGKDAKDAKLDASDEEETVIVEPPEEKPLPVLVPVPEPVKEEPAPPKKEKKKEKKREERKKEEVIEEPALVEAALEVAEAAPLLAADHAKERPAEKVEKEKLEAVKKVKEPKVENTEEIVAAAEPEAAAPEPVVEMTTTVPLLAAAAAPEPAKKNKMEIVEVSGKAGDSDKKKAAAAKEPKPKAPKAAKSMDLVSQVRQAPLSDTEVQAIIDILLLKQSGKEEAADDWIEPGGKESEAKKTARQLSELQELLQEEQNKAANLEKKLLTLRRELNDEKTARTVQKREVEEINQKRNQEVAALNANLQQAVNQLNTAMAHNLQLESSQAHYQATIATLQAQVNNSAADPLLLQELDQLRNIRAELTQTVTGLQQTLAERTAELDQLAASRSQLEQRASASTKQLEEQLAAKAKEVEAVIAGKNEADLQLAANKEEIDQLHAAKLLAEQKLAAAGKVIESESNQQSANKTNLESQLSAVTAAKQQLQLELSVLKEKLSGKELENTRLMEENERLSEQFASSVERPAAEGEEASSKVNGHHNSSSGQEEAEAGLAKAELAWQEKLQTLTVQQDVMASKQKELESELKASREEILKLKSKNDEHLHELGEQKAASLALLGRLFPTLEAGQSIQELEEAAGLYIQSLESKATGAGELHTEEIKKLEAQIANYKTVLAQTESMLNSLQASVESAESNWEKKYQEAISGKSGIQAELDALKAKNAALLEELATLHTAQKEVETLSKQVEEERSSGQALAVKCTELQQMLTLAHQQIAAHKMEGQQQQPEECPPLANGSSEQE